MAKRRVRVVMHRRSVKIWARFGCGILLLVSCAVACKSSSGRGAPPGASSAANEPAKPPPPRCQEESQGASFLLGKASEARVEEDQLFDVPFAVELGTAQVFQGGYLVPALRSEGGQSHAVLVSLGADGASGRVLELGRVHGDVSPPKVSVRDELVVVGVPDHDSSSSIVRLAKIEQPKATGNFGEGSGVTWGALPQMGKDESDAFDIALSAAGSLLVWDDFRKDDGHGTIWARGFTGGDVAKLGAPELVSPKGLDVEAPRLVARPGGFWLAWVAHTMPKDGSARRGANPQAKIDLESLVEFGPRWLELVKLDARGRRQGEALRVSTGGHVLVYDLAAGPDGSAWLAWRDDDTSPGVEKRAVLLARVSEAGHIEHQRLDDERLGAGVPSLLPLNAEPGDDGPKAAVGQAGWLALASVGDRSSFGALGPELKLIEPIEYDPLVAGAEVLAGVGARLLLAKPRGVAVEFNVLRCIPRVENNQGVPAPDAGLIQAPVNEEAPGELQPAPAEVEAAEEPAAVE